MENAITAIIPQTQDEVWAFSMRLANGGFLPKSYTSSGKKGEALAFDVFSAIVMGYELGISPMMAIQSISVVNGTPVLWGDVPLALVRNSKVLVPGSFKEHSRGTIEGQDYVSCCESQRVGDSQPTLTEFSFLDAKKAGLIGKSGTWSTHPKRMFKYKARAFNLRDNFPDVLKGFHTGEELEGEVIDVSPSTIQKKTSFYDEKDPVQISQPNRQVIEPKKEVEPRIIDTPKVEDFEDDIISVFKNTIDSMDLHALQTDTKAILEDLKPKLGPNQYEDLRNYATGALFEKRRAAKDASQANL